MTCWTGTLTHRWKLKNPIASFPIGHCESFSGNVISRIAVLAWNLDFNSLPQGPGSSSYIVARLFNCIHTLVL
ncbi:unnamed protein product [Calypogeia fissa]